MDEMRLSSQEGRGQATVRTSILQILEGVCQQCTTSHQVWMPLSHLQSLVKHHLGRARLKCKARATTWAQQKWRGRWVCCLQAHHQGRGSHARSFFNPLHREICPNSCRAGFPSAATTTTAIKANGNGGSFMKGRGGDRKSQGPPHGQTINDIQPVGILSPCQICIWPRYALHKIQATWQISFCLQPPSVPSVWSQCGRHLWTFPDDDDVCDRSARNEIKVNFLLLPRNGGTKRNGQSSPLNTRQRVRAEIYENDEFWEIS